MEPILLNPTNSVKVVLPCNPAYLSTAQQKKISFKVYGLLVNYYGEDSLL